MSLSNQDKLRQEVRVVSYDTEEAARLISWSNKQFGIKLLTEAELIQWIDGGVGLLEWADVGEEDGEIQKHIDFPTLISLRMICRLHFETPDFKGVPLKDITTVTPRLRKELGIHWPFASKEMWNPYKTISMISDKIRETRNVKAEWESTYNFLDLQRYGRLDIYTDLEFGVNEIACAWLPAEDIKIDPRFVSGSPCLAGTRIPTWIFPGMVKGGDSIAEIADDYGIATERVENALAWERQLATVGT